MKRVDEFDEDVGGDETTGDSSHSCEVVAESGNHNGSTTAQDGVQRGTKRRGDQSGPPAKRRHKSRLYEEEDSCVAPNIQPFLDKFDWSVKSEKDQFCDRCHLLINDDDKPGFRCTSTMPDCDCKLHAGCKVVFADGPKCESCKVDTRREWTTQELQAAELVYYSRKRECFLLHIPTAVAQDEAQRDLSVVAEDTPVIYGEDELKPGQEAWRFEEEDSSSSSLSDSLSDDSSSSSSSGSLNDDSSSSSSSGSSNNDSNSGHDDQPLPIFGSDEYKWCPVDCVSKGDADDFDKQQQLTRWLCEDLKTLKTKHVERLVHEDSTDQNGQLIQTYKLANGFPFHLLRLVGM